MSDKTPSTLSQRGHNKASRHHLRQVGMATSLLRGLGLPLLHKLYNGSKNDATLFPTAISSLVKRVKRLSEEVKDITLVFDKGCNSQKNIGELEREGLHFVGTLKPSEFSHLCKLRLSRYQKGVLSSGKKVLYMETEAEAFGKRRRIIITYNEATATKQLHFTDRQDLTPLEVIESYRDRNEVERL